MPPVSRHASLRRHAVEIVAGQQHLVVQVGSQLVRGLRLLDERRGEGRAVKGCIQLRAVKRGCHVQRCGAQRVDSDAFAVRLCDIADVLVGG